MTRRSQLATAVALVVLPWAGLHAEPTEGVEAESISEVMLEEAGLELEDTAPPASPADDLEEDGDAVTEADPAPAATPAPMPARP